MMNYKSLADAELRNLSAEGDSEAEEELVLRYIKTVRICARPFFLAGGDSEDLIQEGMVGLLSAIRNFDDSRGSAFKTYAVRCIKNRIISAVKSSNSLKNTPLNNGVSLEYLLSDSPKSRAANFSEAFRRIPEEQVLARENKQELYSTFSGCLSEFESEVLCLYLDGLSYSEIAEQLDKDQKSVDNAVQRIRRKLANEPYLRELSRS